MNKKIIIIIAAVVIVVAFLALSCKVIDKGTEGQYTGEVAFDASANSADDWSKVVEELTGKAVPIAEADTAAMKTGVAVSFKGQITEYVSKANGKKNSIVIAPEGYTGTATVSVQLGSIYSGTAVRDAQTLKAFGDFTNQTEWSEYAKALNNEVDTRVVQPLGIDESVQGKTVTVIGVATISGSEITVTPVSMTIE